MREAEVRTPQKVRCAVDLCRFDVPPRVCRGVDDDIGAVNCLTKAVAGTDVAPTEIDAALRPFTSRPEQTSVRLHLGPIPVQYPVCNWIG
jgi:hypothetical protein